MTYFYKKTQTIFFRSSMQTPILFIVGTGRCGTQLLRNIFNLSPSIKVLPETHFIPTLYDKYQLNPVGYDDYFSVIDKIYGSSGEKWILTILRHAKKHYESFYGDFMEYCRSYQDPKNIKDYTEHLLHYLYYYLVNFLTNQS